jgi:hypothetical protein
MPTGYTAAIGEGIEFDKFVMQCARAMGACVMMRDEPIGPKLREDMKAVGLIVERDGAVQKVI